MFMAECQTIEVQVITGEMKSRDLISQVWIMFYGGAGDNSEDFPEVSLCIGRRRRIKSNSPLA